MNEKTRYYYYLSYIYNHALKITEIVDRYEKEYNTILLDDLSYSSICMHIAQIGEHARLITLKCPSFVNDCKLPLSKMNGMRNIIIHTYAKVENSVLLSTIKNDVPDLKKYLESVVDNKVLNNPGLLIETEYEDLVKKTPSQDLKDQTKKQKPKMRLKM